MQDNVYCYPGTNTLINKLNITDEYELFNAETELTLIRLRELQNTPIEGQFDFQHLREIHYYIFQDIYEWAGEVRKVEIGKGNLFCTTACIPSYAASVFGKYYSQCYANKDNHKDFIEVFADNYGDLNALHPFREGNGRTQREFARLVCLKCGYIFDLSKTTHKEMLEASILSFEKADSSLFIDIFSKAIISIDEYENNENINELMILSSDDLIFDVENYIYDYYNYDNNSSLIDKYNKIYREKTDKINNNN